VHGQLISGRYLLEAVLGRGGMATVWRGVDERLGRPVAVKLLDRADTADPVMLQRFDREARTAGGLTHPHIVAVYDVGTDNGVPYLVMELIDGTSLVALLASGPLPIDQAVDFARQTCDALAMAHARGVVHRDIKPANLLLTPAGTVKVCDFGIARLAYQQQTSLTAPHMAIGTSAYMAPEQASAAPVDARTDLYALGCVIYAMLTGHPPFTGDNPLSVLWQHQYQPARAVASLRPDTSADLDVLVARLLAKNPYDRPATATEVRDRLAALASGDMAATQPTRSLPVVSPTETMPALNHGEEPAAAAGGRFLLSPAGIAAIALGAAIIAALTVALFIAFQRPGTDGASTAAGSPPPGNAPTAASTATTDRSAENPSTVSTSSDVPDITASDSWTESPGNASAHLAALFGVIEEQRQTGDLDDETADDLTKELEHVSRRVDHGDMGKAAEQVADLRSELDDLHDDEDITTAGYHAVQASLAQLVETLPPSEEDEHDEDESDEDE
jgi:eukaryotic-like serine/threonine-protein kinase